MFRSIVLLLGIYLVVFKPAEANASQDSYLITKDECINAANYTGKASGCCSEIDLVDKPAKTCQSVMRSYPPTEDVNLNYIRTSIMIECIYEKRNFTKSSDQLNMTAVAVHAKRYYQSDQQDFIVSKYAACEQPATDSWNAWQSNPKTKALLKGTHKPYFMFVFMCVMNQMTTDCPYFVWKGYGPDEKQCEDYARQCRERYFE